MDKPRNQQIEVAGHKISASTLVPLGVVASVAVLLLSAAVVVGANARQIDSNTRCVERHEVEIKELRQRFNDDVSSIKAALARIEANQARGNAP